MSRDFNNTQSLRELSLYISRGISPKYTEDGYLVLNQKCIRDYSIDLNLARKTDSGRRMSEDKFIRKWDVLINSTGVGTLGRVAQITYDPVLETVDSHVTIVRPDINKVSGQFFGFLLKSKQSFIEKLGKGATGQTELSKNDIANIEVSIPSLENQKIISDILLAYDQAITNNNKRIQILEKIAQGLYEEWFVNFRFPGHEKVKIVDSEFGKIPEGWDVIACKEVIDFDPKTQVDRNTENKYLPMGSLSESSMVISDIETRKGNSGSKFQNKDTLLARISPSLENGKTGFVNFLDNDDKAFGSTEFIVMRSKNACPEYVYCLARSTKFRDTAIKSMRGATGRQRVQRDVLEKFKIAFPDDKELINEFNSLAEPMFNQIFTLNKKNKILKNTRDLLLPRLISGEIEV